MCCVSYDERVTQTWNRSRGKCARGIFFIVASAASGQISASGIGLRVQMILENSIAALMTRVHPPEVSSTSDTPQVTC